MSVSEERDAALPKPLRDWLVVVREIKAKAHAEGLRRTATNAREALDTMTRTFVRSAPEIALIRDDLILAPRHPVPVRVYHPDPGRSLPVALFLHGGGHVAGSVALYDPIARRLALASRRVLVSVDYRLAPECPYPAALQDGLACAKQVFAALDGLGMAYAPRLALIGDSGGAALSASIAHLAQFEPGLTIERQVLIYPSLDYSLSQPSVIENGEGYLLERERIIWMFDAYLQHAEDRRSVSPLFMDLTPAYPNTLILTAGFCPLRDEGIAYAERLEAAGIPCTHLDMPGLIHAFLNLQDLVPEACQQAYQAIGDFFG